MKWLTGESESGNPKREALFDCLFLATVVVLSSTPYLPGLALYSDDWTFLAALHDADGSFRSLLAAVMPIELATRPVQGLVLAGLYWSFGLEPLGYHIFNSAVLVATVLLFYLCSRTLRVPRTLAVVVPLVFGLLPHYSTDRFWIAVYQANVSVFLYFLSLFADLRFVIRPDSRRWAWKGLGTIAMVGSLLAYEVTATLFLVNVLVLGLVARSRTPETTRSSHLRTMLAVASNLVFLALTIGYKLTTTVRADATGGYRYRALRILTEAAPVHFGELGIALPAKVGRVLRDYPDARFITVSVLVGLGVCAYLLHVLAATRPNFDRRAHWTAAMVLGAVLFVAGYGVSLMTWEIGFHTTGTNNRTAIGAAIGVGWIFVGAIGWISGLLPSDRLRWRAFAALTGLLVASNTLIVNAVAAFWASAARQQEAVISSIRQQFPELPSDTVLLLDGLCPFDGPAVVFATNWDVSGMLQLQYNDRTLQGDVIKPNTEVTAAGVRTLLFDDVINVYPYGERLIAYHLRTGQEYRLTSVEAAREYFERISVPARPACPPYTDGDGVQIL